MSWIVSSEISLLGLGDQPETVYSGEEEKKKLLEISEDLQGLHHLHHLHSWL